MAINKVALVSAVLLLVISSAAAAAGRDVPPVLPKDNVLRDHGIMNTPEENGGRSESKIYAITQPIFHPPYVPPCASKAVRASGVTKDEKRC
ncbi:hypothetical protein CFC21_001001 [Triticum aestivum]|uniref:Uncharacterized protein n=3 Tax=Triticum TaxID=4564 RepID=A0A9R0UTF3_TRITD|nr:uncharacterized protein LOC125506366 [Triticum urartu]EMS67459.1 hypothetical protein TRIUR3_26282 [Triticum urartu]KAF6982635.1 hypothetical protein CFC21_001001 [Triticum aestivum]VAH02257.1 unnamed protein product [Triticum turgidum subsp. durum]